MCVCTDLLEAGDGVHEFDVQLGVVLSQRLVSVVADELHHRAKRQGVGEAVLPVSMVDLYQLIVSPFPEDQQAEDTVTIHILYQLTNSFCCLRVDLCGFKHIHDSDVTSVSACSHPASLWRRPAPGRSHQACL